MMLSSRQLSIVAHMQIIVEHSFVCNRVDEWRDHIGSPREYENRRPILNVHTTTVPKVGIMPSSVFQKHERFCSNVSCQWVIAVKTEIREFVNANKKRTQVRCNTVDQVRIVDVCGYKEKRG